MQQPTVSAVMTRDVVTVTPQTPFKQIVEVLFARQVSAVPVVDEVGRPIGVVSEADLLRKEEHADRHDETGPGWLSSAQTRASWVKAQGRVARDLMTSPVRTVAADISAAEAARTLAGTGLRRLFVVEEERLIGVVSRRDLLRAFLRDDDDIRAEIERDVMRRLFWVEPGRVDVEVEAGVVTLRGELETAAEAESALEMVRTVPGVVAVDGRLG